ncbi:serine/threonine-protein kinase [Streptomyces sp. NPDC007074]|uniref:serine/threonine-protein kinase n=1 Tax=Streptomyces sp. NPDC007074 TaxID=3156764 RepID=UPI00340B25E8
MTSEDGVTEKSAPTRVIAGRYSLLSRLGAGGMGTVWRAQDEVLHREVAIKEVRPPVGLSEAAVERMYTRLEREAWAAARVSHPNVVTVYDVAMEEGRPWIVMELVRGQSLADLLDAEGTLTAQRAASIGGEVLAALRAAHEAGVLHRDVKPANVLMAKDGRVILTDFGIAVVEGNTALTMTGEVVGSPEFLAPERALGKNPGLASDLWSLGVLLYAAVEGISPFRQNTPLSTLRAIVDTELPPTRRAGALAPVIEGLLRKDPDERLGAEQAAQDLRVVGEGGTLATETAREATYSPTVVTETEEQQQTTRLSMARTERRDTAPPSTTRAEAADAPAAQPPAHQDATEVSAQPSAGHSPAPAHPAPTPPGPIGPVVGETAAQSPSRPVSRRGVALVAAGAALCAVALAGTGYALFGGDDDGGKKGSAAGATASPGSASADAKGGSQGAEEAAAPGAGDDSSTSEGVRMKVTGSRTTYAGECPPPDGEAPTFTATFTVDRLPAQFSYRWVSKDGSVTDDAWRTLSFPNGGSLTKQVSVSLTTWAKAGTFSSEIGVELNAPLRGRSNTVPLSLTCETG